MKKKTYSKKSKLSREKELVMTEALFKQRQRIISLLNEAKQILGIQLPWLKVRMVSYEETKTLGLCWIKQDWISISEKMVSWDENYLRHVVWHELCHAYFNTKHQEDCILMNAILTKPGSKEDLIKALKKHAKISNKINKMNERMSA